MTYEILEDAFYFVSSAPPGDHVAVIKLSTGRVFSASDLAGHDEMPDDLDESDDYVDVPHKSDFDLGKALVMQFIHLRCPQHLARILAIFSRPGAYSRYKKFLEELRLLEAWYAFESDRTREALLIWCEEKGIHLEMRQRV